MRKISIDTLLAWFSLFLLFSGYAWILSGNRGVGFMDIVFRWLPFMQDFRDEIFYGLYWLFTAFTIFVFVYLIKRTVSQLREKDKSVNKESELIGMSKEISEMRQDIRDLIQEIRQDRNERSKTKS